MPMKAAQHTKQQLRAAALAARDALNEEVRSAAAQAIAVRGLPFVLEPGTVVSGYAPIRNELDPMPLMHALAEQGARLALPVILARGHSLSFRAFAPGDRLMMGSLGIPEPSPAAAELMPAVMLVPLAAFDRTGHRIGYGGGYYDYTFSHLRKAHHVLGIGLGFAIQETELVPALPHDAALDYVLTERETFDFRSK
jgi:5-formyltetrahydrofolate cyclo-ligase